MAKHNPAAGAVSLKVLAERKDVESVTKSTPTFMVDPHDIQIKPGFNPRPISPEHVAKLKAAWLAAPEDQRVILFGSIIVTVADGAITVRDGHHRLTMYLELIADGVPIKRVKCEEFKGTEEDCILLSLSAGDGLSVTPLQTGVKYAELVSLGWSFSEIAKARGRSGQHVKDMIALAEAGSEVTDLVASGGVSAATALKTVRKVGSEAGAVLKAGVAAAAEQGKGKLTEKTLAKLGTSFVKQQQKASEVASDYLDKMMESPTFNKSTKAAIQIVADAMEGRQQPPKRSAGDDTSGNGLQWLDGLRKSKSDIVKAAAEHLSAMLAVAAGSRTAMSTTPPTIMTLVEAIEQERTSGGELMAEVMCPEHADLIVYLRASGKAA